MSQRFWPVVSLALALALGAVTLAQPRSGPPAPAPNVVSGADIGFRIDGFDGPQPVGTLVVKVNGRWVEPKTPPGLQLLKP
jgi:hypothetical protein